MTKYVVVISQKEAESLALTCGHETMTGANLHLIEVKAPPTDSFYASQYKVWPVAVPEGVPYELGPDGAWIKCLTCRMKSFNPNDVLNRYCGNCHVYLVDLQLIAVLDKSFA